MSNDSMNLMKQDQRLKSQAVVVRLIRQDMLVSFLLMGLSEAQIEINTKFYVFEMPKIILEIIGFDQKMIIDEFEEWYTRQVQYANKKWPYESPEALDSSALHIYYLLKEKLKDINNFGNNQISFE
jgi:hypothetical protein